ncbi:hypothetical protein I6B53_06705 [Schaalia sp. 19OD2882]|uniref:hypothetical protein n=1 Tax=Schaalia sp. 19OD2882 TaxID=2794089 RepID=UPI001C1E9B5B|nr:hypothetical protein [Schaalia sp. 19OD2882]QWW18842.1 hypothetical protein I6B53_06705 [Schaalia sp. 19OD2882]
MMDLDVSPVEVVRSAMEAAEVMRLINEQAPERSTGTDEADIVTSTVDRDGHLVGMEIAEMWRTGLALDSFSAHIVTALDDAQTARFSSASHSSTPFNMPSVTKKEPSEFFESKIAESTAGPSFGPTVDIADLAEDFIAHSQQMRARQDAPPERMIGNVRVSKHAGPVASIGLDEQWALGRGPEIIINAIMMEVRRTEPEGPEDDILFAAMSAMSRLAEGN